MLEEVRAADHGYSDRTENQEWPKTEGSALHCHCTMSNNIPECQSDG